MKKQQGVVLFFAIIVLLLMTIIGVSLATNSTMSLKMAGAGAERIEALNCAQGELERYPLIKPVNSNLKVQCPGHPSITMTWIPEKEIMCARESRAESNADNSPFACMRVGLEVSYGRNDMGRIKLVKAFKNVPDNVN